MTDQLVERTLRDFSDDLASDRPVPGGGSAAAYAGALGAALCAMVERIAARKAAEPKTAVIDELDALRTAFLRLVDEDSVAFAGVSRAMKMPRGTDDEKRVRKDRLQAGLASAARVPLEVARTARRLLEVCERSMGDAAPMTVSDVGVGALMAETALRGAAFNVMINLASLDDHALVKELSEELDRTLEGADQQRKRIIDFVESRIAR